MKLYYTPGACSLASHIALSESGMDFDIEKVDLGTKKTETGRDFNDINAKGYVPTLEVADGEVLTENAAILQFISDQQPENGSSPKLGTIERARLQEMLIFIATELHKGFGVFFNPAATDAEKERAATNVGRKFNHLDGVLSDGRDYLLGGEFTVADAYLFVMTNWANFTKVPLDQYKNVVAFSKRVGGREKVLAALKAEGLLN